MLSQKAKYALHAMLALAAAWDSDSLQIGDIAEQKRLPRRFLEQILLDLKHSGLVVSKRGKNGGYTLIRPPSEISIAQVARTIDGPLAPLPCLSRTAYQRCPDCADEAGCTIRRIYAKAYAATLAVLETSTLADALRDEGDDDPLVQLDPGDIPRSA